MPFPAVHFSPLHLRLHIFRLKLRLPLVEGQPFLGGHFTSSIPPQQRPSLSFHSNSVFVRTFTFPPFRGNRQQGQKGRWNGVRRGVTPSPKLYRGRRLAARTWVKFAVPSPVVSFFSSVVFRIAPLFFLPLLPFLVSRDVPTVASDRAFALLPKGLSSQGRVRRKVCRARLELFSFFTVSSDLFRPLAFSLPQLILFLSFLLCFAALSLSLSLPVFPFLFLSAFFPPLPLPLPLFIVPLLLPTHFSFSPTAFSPSLFSVAPRGPPLLQLGQLASRPFPSITFLGAWLSRRDRRRWRTAGQRPRRHAA